MPSTKAPKYVLTANNHEDKDKQIANLKAMVDEREKVVKATMEENEELKGSKSGGLGKVPVVRASLQAMHDEEEDEGKKATIKAAIDVFNQGHGSSKTGGIEDEEVKDTPNKKVVEAAVARAIKPFQDKEVQPIIAKILTANQIGGATEEQMVQLTKSLTAKSYDQVMQYANDNSVLIANALKSQNEQSNTDALTASIENNLPFNGDANQGFALTGKSISIDDALEGAVI